jgi:transposase
MSELTREELQRRRLKAGRLLSKGVSQADVAAECGVSRETARRWKHRLDEGGLTALRNATRLGRPAGLDDAQRRQLSQALMLGGAVHGFPTEEWTLPRAAQLIDRLFGKRYSQAQVWRILKSLGSDRKTLPPSLRRVTGASRESKRKR